MCWTNVSSFSRKPKNIITPQLHIVFMLYDFRTNLTDKYVEILIDKGPRHRWLTAWITPERKQVWPYQVGAQWDCKFMVMKSVTITISEMMINYNYIHLHWTILNGANINDPSRAQCFSNLILLSYNSSPTTHKRNGDLQGWALFNLSCWRSLSGRITNEVQEAFAVLIDGKKVYQIHSWGMDVY